MKVHNNAVCCVGCFPGACLCFNGKYWILTVSVNNTTRFQNKVLLKNAFFTFDLWLIVGGIHFVVNFHDSWESQKSKLNLKGIQDVQTRFPEFPWHRLLCWGQKHSLPQWVILSYKISHFGKCKKRLYFMAMLFHFWRRQINEIILKCQIGLNRKF